MSVRRLRLVVAGFVSLWWLAWPAAVVASAGSSPGQVVGDGQAVTLPADEAVPASASALPPLAGLAFWAPTVRAAMSGSFATSQGGYSAPSGDVLVFVAVDSQVFAPPFGSIDRGVAPPSLTLGSGGGLVTLPLSGSGLVSRVAGSSSGDQGSEYDGRWLVAVPAGSHPVLTASGAGFSQADEVVSAERLGFAPTVLYRDGSGPLGLDVRPSLSGQLAVQTSGGPVELPVTVAEAVLSYFRLDEKSGPPSGLPDDRAYLLVDVTVGAGDDSAGDRVVLAGSAAGSLVAAGVAGGPAMAASFAPQPLYAGAVLNGVFGVVVPASATQLTLTVGAATSTRVAAETGQSVTPTEEPATVSGAAHFSLSFPAPSALPATVGASASPGSTVAGTVPAPVSVPAAQSSKPSSASGSGAGGVVLAERAGAAAAGATVVVVLGVVVWRRKTVLVAAAPVERDPPSGPPPSRSASDDVATAEPGSERALVRDGDATGPVSATERAFEAGAPRAPAAGGGPELVVRVLGPLVVQGLTGPIRRRSVLRALIALALAYPRPVGGETLRGLLAASEDSELSATTLRSELSRLRAVLPAGMLPDRASTAGYVLAGRVEIDWAEFQSDVAHARGLDGAGRVGEGLGALRLVRGRVLEAAGWHGIDRMVWEIEASIDRFAADMASEALELCLPAEAAEAAGLGLRVVPGSPALWRLRHRAAEQGSGELPATIAARATAETGLVLTEPG